MSKYEVISAPNAGKYGPEITQYLDTFHKVLTVVMKVLTINILQISSHPTTVIKVVKRRRNNYQKQP